MKTIEKNQSENLVKQESSGEPVTSAIRKLEAGEELCFSITRLGAVRAAVCRLNAEMSVFGIRYRAKKDLEKYRVVVERLK